MCHIVNITNLPIIKISTAQTVKKLSQVEGKVVVLESTVETLTADSKVGHKELTKCSTRHETVKGGDYKISHQREERGRWEGVHSGCHLQNRIDNLQ